VGLRMTFKTFLTFIIFSISLLNVTAQELKDYEGLWFEEISNDLSDTEYILILPLFDDAVRVFHCSPGSCDNYGNFHVLDYDGAGFIQDDGSIRVDTEDTFFYLAFDYGSLSHYHNGRNSFSDRYFERLDFDELRLEEIDSLDDFHKLTAEINEQLRLSKEE
jgi:hypothetical protein